MFLPSLEDTITAIATPSGVGAIAIIRISGNSAISVADAIFRGKIRVSDAKSHTVHYGKISDEKNELIDDVLLSVFKAPNSYTGEDLVEISCHGNPLIAEKIIGQILKHGVRIAEPGEFTKRAFLNNKIDLAQAEAVVDIITSRSEASLRGARNQLDGILSKNLTSLRQSLLDILSFLELELDFAEEEIEFVTRKDLSQRVDSLIVNIGNLLKTYSFGKVIRDGVNVAIVGKPNVGKSSLLNYLLKESRAIVSHIPGTTRDVIREEITIDGILFRLFDTAGIRDSDDLIEIEGVKRSNEAIIQADIILLVSDVEQGYSTEIFEQLCKLGVQNKTIKVINKIDLNNEKLFPESVKISALTGLGIETLLEELKEKAIGTISYSERSAVVTNIRHYNCLKSAVENLSNAHSSIENGLSGEFIAVDLRAAINSIGEIIGEVTSEDLLNNIFSQFCIGK